MGILLSKEMIMGHILEHILGCGAAQVKGSDSSVPLKTLQPAYQSLNYACYEDAFQNGTLKKKIEAAYNIGEEALEELAEDPDHSGQVTLSSLIETMVALELEQDYVFGGLQVSRGPAGLDLEDGWQRKWDVKTPPYLPKYGGFHLASAVESVVRKFERFSGKPIGILLCVSFMRLEDFFELDKGLLKALTVEQRFHIRPVHIKGCI